MLHPLIAPVCVVHMGPICTHTERSQGMLASFGCTKKKKKEIMAAETSAIEQESKKQTCILVEEDVSGAALPRESVEECSVVQLKRWLTCRGAKTSGKKSALVSR